MGNGGKPKIKTIFTDGGAACDDIRFAHLVNGNRFVCGVSIEVAFGWFQLLINKCFATLNECAHKERIRKLRSA